MLKHHVLPYLSQRCRIEKFKYVKLLFAFGHLVRRFIRKKLFGFLNIKKDWTDLGKFNLLLETFDVLIKRLHWLKETDSMRYCY